MFRKNIKLYNILFCFFITLSSVVLSDKLFGTTCSVNARVFLFNVFLFEFPILLYYTSFISIEFIVVELFQASGFLFGEKVLAEISTQAVPAMTTTPTTSTITTPTPIQMRVSVR